MDGQSSLSPGHACFWLKSEIARACAQTVHGAYLSHPAAPGVQYQHQYLSWRVNTFFRWQLNACMHCPAVKEKKVRHHLCSALLLLSLALSLFSLISLTFPTTQIISTFSCSYSYSHSHWQRTASHSQACSYDEHFHGRSQVYSY